MELRDLRTLIAVAKCGGFSAAAKALGTTQSTVAMATFSAEMHEFSVKNILSRLGYVRSTATVLAALG